MILAAGSAVAEKRNFEELYFFKHHIYYLILSDVESRDKFITYMKERLIGTTFHYVPLHNSNYAKIHTRNGTSLVTTEDMASRIVRLPIWPGLDVHVDYIVEQTNNFFKES